VHADEDPAVALAIAVHHRLLAAPALQKLLERCHQPIRSQSIRAKSGTGVSWGMTQTSGRSGRLWRNGVTRGGGAVPLPLGAKDSAVPIEPGAQEIEATVTVTFAIG
jgi:hypothetical protein